MGAILAIGNLADSATLTENTSGAMLRPLTELQIPWARGLARGPINVAAGVTTLTLRADLGSAKQWSALGLIGVNEAYMGVGAAFSNTAFGNTDRGSVSFDNVLAGGNSQGNSLWYVNSEFVTCRYIELYIEAFNLPSGLEHVDVRRLFVASADGTAVTTAVFSNGVDFDWSLTYIDMSSAEVTPRGGVFTSPQGAYRELQFGISGMTAAEAKDLRTWISTARRTTECVVSLRDEDPGADQSKNTIYGRLVEWAPIVHTGGDTYACESITVHETPHPPL